MLAATATRLSVLGALVLAAAAGPALAATETIGYDLPAGFAGVLLFTVPGEAPLHDLTFHAGGHPDLRIDRFVAAGGSIHITFAEGSPTGFSQFWRDNPLLESPETQWVLEVRNPTDHARHLTFGARWD